MDYKQKYDELIERLRKAKYDDNVCDERFCCVIDEIAPELSESEDDVIRKAILELVKQSSEVLDKQNQNNMINWLEKQGQKPILDFKAKDWYVSKVDGKIRNIYHSVDKVEPKFNVGDWVADNNGKVAIIYDLQKTRYVGHYTDGTDFICKYSNEYLYHLWTIQDAKDGDVLFHSNSASNGIFIFKELLKYEFGEKVICYCDYDSEDHFCLGEHHTCCWSDAKILHPATKEQRDIIFTKMKEAGYEWSEETHELKKISQRMVSAEAKEALYDKPTDEEMKELLRTEYEKGRADAYCEVKAYAYKREWREEDEKKTKELLALEHKACITKTIEWFFIQLNEGNMECRDIEKFVDNYRKYMEE